MAAVCIVNLEDIRTLAREQGERLSSLAQREWLERGMLRYVMDSEDCLRPAKPSRAELSVDHVARAVAANEPSVRFLPSAKLLEDLALVVDWLAGLRKRDPRLAGKIRRVTFADALEMSHRWHRQLRKAAERTQTKSIPNDPVGAPWLLDATSLGPGWSWVWIKSPEARKTEGEAMGHCVGSGGYESLRPSEAVLSLRDPDSVPHVTLHLDENRVLQAVTKGNGNISPRYRAVIERGAAIIGARLVVGGNPERAISDGCHRQYGDVIYIRHSRLHREEGPAVEWANGTKEWYRDGRHHREDGPAIEWASGTKWWYRGGQLHRRDGPAVEGADGRMEWCREGKLHRDDGPAVVRADGTKEWYRDGQRHSEDGPAVMQANGTRMWYRDGKLHRDDGPAIEWANGMNRWYVDGERVDKNVPPVSRERVQGMVYPWRTCLCGRGPVPAPFRQMDNPLLLRS